METLLGNAAAAGLFLVAVGVLHLLASIPYRRPQWDDGMEKSSRTPEDDADAWQAHANLYGFGGTHPGGEND